MRINQKAPQTLISDVDMLPSPLLLSNHPPFVKGQKKMKA